MSHQHHEGASCCCQGLRPAKPQQVLYESFREPLGESNLSDKIETRAVVDMIKNADLYDLISISLRANDLKDEQVEHFIQKALTSRQSVRASQETSLF